MLKIGLTGGIGSGKSLVSDTFASIGVPVIDTDLISREVLRPGSETLLQLANKLGQSILSADGSLRRRKLKESMFKHASTRNVVDSIVHPAIKTVMLQDIDKLQTGYCIVVIPLLIEKNWQNLVDRILLVNTPRELRIQRVLARDQLSRENIMKILRSQATDSERLAYADDIINNDSDPAYVIEQVKLLHQKYLHAANKV